MMVFDTEGLYGKKLSKRAVDISFFFQSFVLRPMEIIWYRHPKKRAFVYLNQNIIREVRVILHTPSSKICSQLG